MHVKSLMQRGLSDFSCVRLCPCNIVLDARHPWICRLYAVVIYIESIPNRSSPPAILLRESCREAGTVKKRTLANLSRWSPALIEGLRILLKKGTAGLDDAFDLVRSLPHGHVAAVLGTLKKLDRRIDPKPSRDQVLAMIVARILEPASKLARRLATAVSTLGELLDAELDENVLYGAGSWNVRRRSSGPWRSGTSKRAAWCS